MKWLKSFFPGKPAAGERYVPRQVTHSDPLVIQNPKIGFLNLIGASASPLVHEDATTLKPLFSRCLKSDGDVPICDVLMIYATIKSDGVIQNTAHSLREIITKSRAPIVVIATENSVESYKAVLKDPGAGRANLVMTMTRNGQIFPNFFKELFGMMHHGITMPMAWVKLAPQIPGREQDNAPRTVCAMEVTHVLFK
ncbi:MAG TPA: hypothetical protein VGK22_21165 [Candidatus Angelobacter sp.]|jgi:hypothetical protein